MQLTTRQEEVLISLVQFIVDDNRQSFVLSGVSGAGKTTIISELMNRLPAISKMQELVGGKPLHSHFKLTATTHKAADVVATFTGYTATTIHSLLNMTAYIDYTSGKQVFKTTRNTHYIDDKIIIIDEASMINHPLLKDIQRYLSGSKVIYVLDKYQAMPVGYDYIPVISELGIDEHLADPVRYDKDSHLDNVCKQLRDYIDDITDELPTLCDDKQVISVSGEEFKHLATQTMKLAKDFPNHSKVLCYTNAMSVKYNNFFRRLHINSDVLEVGEKLILRELIQLPNSKYGHKEKLVTVTKVDPAQHGKYGIKYYTVWIDNHRTCCPINPEHLQMALKKAKYKKDWRAYFEIKETFLDARPTYASTVHCAQGSTYDTCFIDVRNLSKCKNPYEAARLLYVALTRAKGTVYVYQ